MKDISKNSFSTDKECTNIIAKDFLFVVKQLNQFTYNIVGRPLSVLALLSSLCWPTKDFIVNKDKLMQKLCRTEFNLASFVQPPGCQ